MSDPREALVRLLVAEHYGPIAAETPEEWAWPWALADIICDPANRDVVLPAMGGQSFSMLGGQIAWMFPTPKEEAPDGE